MSNARTMMDTPMDIRVVDAHPGQPLPKAKIDEIMKPFGVDGVVDWINEKIKREAIAGKRVIYVNAAEAGRSLKGQLPSAPSIAAETMSLATDRFRSAGYTVTRHDGDYRESESWSIKW